jgi:SAM-dependent methyltransferase
MGEPPTGQADPGPPWDSRTQRRTWEALGSQDPLWAVLSEPEAIGGRWDDGAFWETGRVQVAFVFQYLAAKGIAFRRGVALDFGCGVGRLAGPFAEHFARVVGLDIAKSMLDVARTRNPAGRRVGYVQSAATRLPFRDAAFDFVFSHLVLQHCPGDAVESYVAEFARVLANEGVATFTMPARLGETTTRAWRGRAVETREGVVSMDMVAIPMTEILALIAKLPVRLELVFTSLDETGVEYGVYVMRKLAARRPPSE